MWSNPHSWDRERRRDEGRIRIGPGKGFDVMKRGVEEEFHIFVALFLLLIKVGGWVYLALVLFLYSAAILAYRT